jgi:hypothetical protein
MAYTLTKAEQEVVIGKCADETHWTIYSTDPYWTQFFRALAKKMGARELQHQGGTKFFLPATELRFTSRRRLRLSEAEKARRADRLQPAREPESMME